LLIYDMMGSRVIFNKKWKSWIKDNALILWVMLTSGALVRAIKRENFKPKDEAFNALITQL